VFPSQSYGPQLLYAPIGQTAANSTSCICRPPSIPPPPLVTVTTTSSICGSVLHGACSTAAVANTKCKCKSVVITKHKRVVHASFRFPVWIACLHRSGDQDIPVISSQFIPASFRFPARPGPSTLLGLVSIQSR
jgi:hypothetical protein